MFRNYPENNQYSQPAKNIIIFAGCAHIKNIEKILLTLQFDIIFKTGFKCDQDEDFVSKCINVSKLKQPLFKAYFFLIVKIRKRLYMKKIVCIFW